MCQVRRGAADRRHLAQVTLVFATHCFAARRAGGAGCVETRLLGAGEPVASASGTARSGFVGDRKKK